MKTAKQTNRVFALSVSDDRESAELTMNGEIVPETPIDFWTGEPVKGAFIKGDEFLDDLKKLDGVKKLTLRMNSLGGDSVTSIMIHNRLRELSRGGCALTAVVDGAAMSGGSLIICACDRVKVNPSSLIMMHKCWTRIYGGYNADELREEANQLDAYDDAQKEIYARKSGLGDKEILQMMSETTIMTGKEAIEKGFADELLDAEPAEIAASADKTRVYANGYGFFLPKRARVPETIPVVCAENGETYKAAPDAHGASEPKEGGKNMTLEEFRAQNPEAYSQIEQEMNARVKSEAERAQIAERARIQEIDALSALFDRETVENAKYASPCTAQEMTYRAAVESAKKGGAFMRELESEYRESNAGNVSGEPAPDDAKIETNEDKMKAGFEDAKRYASGGKE